MARRESQLPSIIPTSSLLVVAPPSPPIESFTNDGKRICIHIEDACKKLKELGIYISEKATITDFLKCSHCLNNSGDRNASTT